MVFLARCPEVAGQLPVCCLAFQQDRGCNERTIGIRPVAALLAGLGMVPGIALPQVSVYRQWRIVDRVSLKAENGWSRAGSALIAPSRSQAWALGFIARSRTVTGTFLEHGNGRRWRMTATPRSE